MYEYVVLFGFALFRESCTNITSCYSIHLLYWVGVLFYVKISVMVSGSGVVSPMRKVIVNYEALCVSLHESRLWTFSPLKKIPESER